MTRARRATTLLLAGSLAGCTSISWRDASGVEHHAGLVAAREDAVGGTSIVRRYSLGSDLRLSGEDAGWTLGLHASRTLRPERVPTTPGRLAAEVAAFLAAGPTPPVESRWRFLWFSDARSDDVAVIDDESLGVQVGAARAVAGFTVVYSSVHAVTGSALEDDVVLITGRRNGVDAARLWSLGSDASRNRETPGGTEVER